jgi:hypothetical protein
MNKSKSKFISFASLMLVLFSCSTPNNIPNKENLKKEVVMDFGYKYGGSASLNVSFNKKDRKFGIKSTVEGFTSGSISAGSRLILKLHRYDLLDSVFSAKARFEGSNGVEVASIPIDNFIAPSSTDVTFKGLQPDKKYYISARAYTKFISPNPPINVNASGSSTITGNFGSLNIKPTDIVRINGSTEYVVTSVPDSTSLVLNTTVSAGSYSFDFRRNIVGIGDIGGTGNMGMAADGDQVGGGTAPARVAGNEEYVEVQSNGSTTIQNDTNTNNIWDMNIQLMKDLDAVVTGTVDVTDGTSPSLLTPKSFPYYSFTAQEKVINDTRDKNNTNSSVSLDGSGNMSFVWQIDDKDSAGTKGIYYKRIGTDGIVNQNVTDDPVNTTLSGDQMNPQIQMADNKKLAIVWEGEGSGDSNGIFYRRYQPVGDIIDDIDTSEVLLVDGGGTSFIQTEPSLGMEKSTGDFVVCWTDPRSGNNDIYFTKVQMSTGSSLANTQAESNSSSQSDSSVAVNTSGDFVITWVDNRSGNNDIYARRFNSIGTPQGSSFKVNTIDLVSQHNPSVDIDSAGNFVITWVDNSGANPDIKAQMFNNTGSKIGDEITVNNYINGTQLNPKVNIEDDKSFTIVWDGEVSGSDTQGIAMRTFLFNNSSAPYFVKPIDNQTIISSDAIIGPKHNPSFEISNKKMIASWNSITSQTESPTNNNIMFKLLSKGK